jgi:hypothetical protein
MEFLFLAISEDREPPRSNTLVTSGAMGGLERSLVTKRLKYSANEMPSSEAR